MYKLLNMADFCSNEELEKEMQYLSQKYGFDGFELIKFFDGDNSPLKGYIKGYHMRFFPFMAGIISRRFYFFVWWA